MKMVRKWEKSMRVDVDNLSNGKMIWIRYFEKQVWSFLCFGFGRVNLFNNATVGTSTTRGGVWTFFNYQEKEGGAGQGKHTKR